MTRAVFVLAFLLFSSVVFAQEGSLVSRPIVAFDPTDADNRQFGSLRYEAGFSLTSDLEIFGGISAFRYFEDGKSIVGVTDEGNWLFARVERDDQGKATGLTDLFMQPLLDQQGQPFKDKRDADSEGMAIVGDEVWVSFERRPRILRYSFQPRNMGRALGAADFIIPSRELRQNRGMEALALAPASSGFGAHPVVISERSLDSKGNIFAAILSGPRRGIFKIARSGEFDITDAAFLPNGKMLILERRFSILGGVGMRMRRIDMSTAQSAAYDGDVLIEADMGKAIDNMEALDIYKRADGRIVVGMMSDDNFSILQRNLYLEFTLDD